MGGLIRGENWWWNYFKDEFFSIFYHIRGQMLVVHGYSEIEIDIDPTVNVNRIFVAVQSENIPVCAGNVDMVGSIQNGDHSFIIYADIQSNSAVIYWLIDYSDNGQNDVPIDI
jgi:hypothetical protein